MNRKKKICFFLPELTTLAGTERSMCIVANALVNSYDVLILSNKISDKQDHSLPLDERVKIVTIGVEDFKLGYLKLVYEMLAVVKRECIDFFVSVEVMSVVFSGPLMLLSPFLARRTKFITWEHFNFSVDLGKRVRRYCRYFAGKFADAVVVLTERDVELWKSSFQVAAKIIAINNAATFPISKKGYSVDSRILLAIGRFTYQKGFDDLITLWREIILEGKDNGFCLHLVGEGPDRDTLLRQVKLGQIEDKVVFHPITSNIASHYEAASVFVMTSRFEGLPMVLLEAESFGLPIIAFDCLTGPSEIIKDGKNGFLIPDRNMGEFKKKLSDLINDSSIRTAMSKAAKDSVQKFSVDNTGYKWRTLFDSI